MKNILKENMRRFGTKNLNEIEEPRFLRQKQGQKEPKLDINGLTDICRYWETLNSNVKNKFVSDKNNYLSNGYPIDIEQICTNPESYLTDFTSRDVQILRNILQLGK